MDLHYIYDPLAEIERNEQVDLFNVPSSFHDTRRGVYKNISLLNIVGKF